MCKLYQGFFNVEESFKPWVMKSAAKKWRAFKNFLKSKHYNVDLSIKENIDNGCMRRIPRTQWAWLVKYWRTHKAKVSEKMLFQLIKCRLIQLIK